MEKPEGRQPLAEHLASGETGFRLSKDSVMMLKSRKKIEKAKTRIPDGVARVGSGYHERRIIVV